MNLRFQRFASARRLNCLLLVLVFLISGCGVSRQTRGVANKWRDNDLAPFVRGRTTQAEVIAQLGPPSQVIALKNQVVFYYMLEHVESRGAFFLLFNWVKKKISYDRAIFFFDDAGLLTEYSYSLERIPYEKAP